MALANDSITVTPGSGATVATHLAGSKEHQAFVQVGSAGHIYGTQPTWTVASQNSTNVAAARTTHADLFNAAGSGVVLRVCGIYIIPTLTAVAGIGLTWEIIRTSAVGTGGAARTPASYDTGNASLPAQITCRSKPTGGATTAATLLYPNTSSEETNPYAGLASQNNHVARPCIEAQWLVLREGEGLKVDQTFSSSIGSTNVVFVFTVE